MPDLSLGVVLLKKPIEAVASVATGKVKELLNKIKAERNVKLIHHKLSAMQRVKTIWNVDRALMISSFYYPASIKSPTGQTQQISGLDDLPANHVVLEGTVGQGKSILLRWLLGREVRSGERIPLFIELRRVPVGKFDEFVLTAFSDLVGVAADKDLFELFAENGKLSLLLDGFDELDPNNVTTIASSVERLAQLYPQTRILITSRPDSGIENSALFDIVPIAKLTVDSLPAFFGKILSRDKELARRLIAATKTSTAISELVSTPLLATLLTIVYRAHQKIPLDFSEFYDELFQILLVRHDRSKIGYERHRKTKLGDKQIQEVFEAFCFKTKAKSKTSIERGEALIFVQQALASAQIQCDEASFLQDVKKVTCLLSEEGARIEFLHQSVQEFFAARYIRSRPEGVGQKFYEQLLATAKWQVWRQELEFLSQIDRYRASKYFFVPAIVSTLKYLRSDLVVAPKSVLRQHVSDLIAVRQDTLGPDGKKLPAAKHYVVHIARKAHYLLNVYESRTFNLLFTRKEWRTLFDGSTHHQQLTYSAIAEGSGIGAELDVLLDGTTKFLQSELADHRASVKAFDESEAFINL